MKARLYKLTKLLFIIVCFYSYNNALGNQKLPVTGQVVDYLARPVENAEIAIIQAERIINNEYTSKNK